MRYKLNESYIKHYTKTLKTLKKAKVFLGVNVTAYRERNEKCNKKWKILRENKTKGPRKSCKQKRLNKDI